MRVITLPNPPSASHPQNQSDQQKFNHAVTEWMSRVKGLIEQASRTNDTPAQNAMVVADFTAMTTVSGTMTPVETANAVATLVNTLMQKGILSPTVSRQSNT